MTSNDPDAAMPVLNGIVLAGGKSLRMGRDKSALEWHGKAQHYFMADLLQNYCENVFISCRPEQQPLIHTHYKTLPDAYEGLGPYGALLSAFQKRADRAWLVTACDLPLLDADTLSYLVAQRDPNAMATTFESPFDGLPEPLITIWEPKAYAVLLAGLSQGKQCPRKPLLNNHVKIIQAKNAQALMNVNTPQEFEKAAQLLQQNNPHQHAE